MFLLLHPLANNRYGENGDTGKVPLKKSQNKDKFKRGATDNFVISAANIGVPTKLTIGHDGHREGLLTDSSWFLDRVVVDVPSLGKTVTFPNPDGWLDKSKGKGQLEVTLYPGEGGANAAVEVCGPDHDLWHVDHDSHSSFYFFCSSFVSNCVFVCVFVCKLT